MANPSRLAAGQVIKIPGKAPPVIAPAAARAPACLRRDCGSAGTRHADRRTGATPAPPANDLAALLQKGRRLEASGDLPGAYGAFSDAAALSPGQPRRDPAARRRESRAHPQLRSAKPRRRFKRQNLDLAIAKWDRLLELDPANQKAKLERERALELRKKMNEKFGKPSG